MAENADAATRQRGLADRYLKTAHGINDMQWEDILVRVLREGLDRRYMGILGAITACAKHKHEKMPGFDDELTKVLRMAGPKFWLGVLQALAGGEKDQDRVAYFTVAPLYYLALAIVVESDNLSQEGQKPNFSREKAMPSWWDTDGY